jgi:DNA invertase Pin-like site-specific DNA recombinase
MGKRRYTAEQVINRLREAEVELARGMKVSEVCKKLGIAEYTYYRRRVSEERPHAARLQRA